MKPLISMYSISNCRISGISGVAWFFEMFRGVDLKSKQNIVIVFNFFKIKTKHFYVKAGIQLKLSRSWCATFYLSKFTQPLKSRSNVENISHRGVPFYLLFKDFSNYKYLEIEIFTKFDKKLNSVEFMSLKITKLYLHSLYPPLNP